jgi:hypothetical protein
MGHAKDRFSMKRMTVWASEARVQGLMSAHFVDYFLVFNSRFHPTPLR